MKMGSVPNILKKYHELGTKDREMISSALEHHARSNPFDRYYMYWQDLSSIIKSPNQNLIETLFHYNEMRFHIKLVSGMEEFQGNKLFVIDDQIMDKWERL
jgi:hypothetical protein